MSRRTRSPVARLTVALAALAIAFAGCLMALAPRALADGDPGSDVLVYETYFTGYDSGLSDAQQIQLGDLLNQLRRSGTPVRVAIIAHPDDLGTVTPLWREPQRYALYLGAELSLAYDGRLLIVMPNGFGFYWYGHATTGGYKALASLPIGTTAAGLLASTENAVRAVAGAAGAPVAGGGAKPSSSSSSQPSGAIAPVPRSSSAGTASNSTPGKSNDGLIGTIVLAVLVLAGLIALARRGPPEWRPRLATLGQARWAIPGGVLGIGVIAFAVIAIEVSSSTANSAPNDLATNPDLDPGTSLYGKPAPTFTLYDQSGQRVSLQSYRGKVVILAFTDSECTTICPLTTTAMLDAKRMLGPAGSKVQLLGVDANPKSIAIDDVLSYSQLHGMLGHWQFLTGTLGQLKGVWKDYDVEAEIQHGLIAHTPALFVIDPQGKMRKVYITQQAYAAVGQLGQILAREASGLLPGHPAVQSHLSYAEVSGITPAHRTRLPRLGGGTLRLGPGNGARLYVFFATWDQEVTSLAGHLDVLNGYAATAARAGLPPLAAVDEGSVEPDAAALPNFVRSLHQPLSYPVVIDNTGRVADGYEVQGQPWFVLASPSGAIKWYWNVDVSGWPTVAALQTAVRGALSATPSGPSTVSAAERELAGSPAPLAALHAQASELLAGDQPALDARVKALRGYPVVVNVWGSWCPPCQAEFGLFASASARYGKRVAFLGADYNDVTADAQTFLNQHHVSYPSYQTSGVQSLVPAGILGTPTTFFFNRVGKLVHTQIGQYYAQGTLDQNIQTYALGS
jgi:cytochrome oxidase Cu insertion factor (SCO1/SenC/PrrC family)/thiol-disulfide isomerase/thioredoxin